VPQINPQYIAGGNITAGRFVTFSPTADFTVTQAGANVKIAGISMVGTREAPIPSVTTPYAAQSGESLRVHGDTEVCHLTLGGTVEPGDDLKSDADGKGVKIAGGTTTQEIGATSLQGGVSGDSILVQVSLRAEGQTAAIS